MKLKRYFSSILPVCVAVFVFRIAELILTVDPRTGHYTTGSVLPTIFNGVLIAVALYFVTCLFSKRELKPAAVRLHRASLFDLIVGVLAAVFTIASSVFSLMSGIADGTVVAGLGMIRSVSFWNALLSVCAGLFLIFLVTYPKRTAKSNAWRLFSLTLTMYHLSLLLYHFQDLDTVFSHAFGIYIITYYAIATMASMHFSKILARLFGRKLFTFFTALMAVFVSLRFADAVLYLIPENPYAIPMELLPFVSDALITLLFLSQARKLLKGAKRRSRPEPDQVEAEPLPTESVPNEQ